LQRKLAVAIIIVAIDRISCSDTKINGWESTINQLTNDERCTFLVIVDETHVYLEDWWLEG
jgi:hypothetical protein